ncbi:MAG: hypothetical protein JNM84_23175 [Planctomycetes bacterium]|nr:hypothetical protein [Planctomycetota bacterium]
MNRSLLVLFGVLALAGLAALLWLTGDTGASRDAQLESGSARADGDAGLSAPLLAPATTDPAEAARSAPTHPLLRTQRDAAAAPWRSAGWILRGRVESSAGEPLAGVEVAATLDAEVRSIGAILDQISATRRGAATARTDAAGRFVLRDLPETTLRVRAWREDGAQIERGGLHATPPEEEAAELVMRFELGLALTVVYRDREGRALAGQHLAALRNLEDVMLGLESTALTTDEEGIARVSDLAPGRYTLITFPADSAMQVLRDDLQLYSDTRLELEAGGTGRLELSVRDAQRAPIAGAQFLALFGSGRRGGLVHGTTDAQGSLIIERAPLGRMQLAFLHAPGHTSWPPSPESVGGKEVREDEPCRLEVELAAVRALRGRAIDANSGAPLVDAELCFRAASDPRGEIAARTRTDARGSFSVERLPRERLHVSVSTAQLRPLHAEIAPLSMFASREGETPWDWIDLSAETAPESIELKVPAPGGIAGVIRDAGGEIVARQALVATLERRGFRCRVETLSDEQGRFAFDGLPTPATWRIAPARAVEGAEPLSQMLEAGARVEGLVLTLPSRFVLRGTVSGGGAPVPGARLRFLTSKEQRIERRTDAAGAFELIVGTASLRVQVEAEDFARYESAIQAENGAFAPLAIELARAIELQGRILDERREPLPAARVTWSKRSPEGKRVGRSEFARSDAAGEFRFGALAEGPGELEVQLGGYRRWKRVFEDPRAAKDVEIALERGLTVSGVVRLPDGGAASGANVFVTGEGQPNFSIAAREDGSFEVAGLEEGPCTLEASPPKDASSDALRASERLQVSAGTAGHELRLRSGAALRGTLDASDLPGLAWPSVRIAALDAKQRELAQGQPDAQGRFELSGLDPEAEFRVLVYGGAGALRREAFGPYRPGQEIGSLRLQRGAKLSGRLVDRTGQPIAGIRVTCVETSDRANLTPPQLASSDKDGRFAFDGCSSSPLKLLFLLPTTPPREQIVDGVHAGAVELEITLDL